jgi:hypothetical protein
MTDMAVNHPQEDRVRNAVQFLPNARRNHLKSSTLETTAWTDAASPAKRFPGVCALTEITRHFAKQGVRLPMRRKAVDAAEGSGEEDEEEDELE